MRDSCATTILLLASLATLSECFLAWPSRGRRQDYDEYLSAILEPPSILALGVDDDDDVGRASIERGICLYVAPDLPPCDFERLDDSTDQSEDTREDYQNVDDRLDPRTGSRFPKPESSRQTRSGANRRDVSSGRVVYTIEGCLPARLPFDMPVCRDEDLAGGLFEVRKLYPFRVKASTSKEAFVFPEFNFGQWLKMMRRFDRRREVADNNVASATASEKSDHGVTPSASVSFESGDAEESAGTTRTTRTSRHRQMAPMRATRRKTARPRATIASRYVSKGSPIGRVIAHRESSVAGRRGVRHERVEEYPGRDDHQEAVSDEDVVHEDNDLQDLGDHRVHPGVHQEADRDGDVVLEDNDLEDLRGDLEDLVLLEFRPLRLDGLPLGFRMAPPPTSTTSRETRSRREVVGKGSEFPYAKAIPFDPRKLGQRARDARRAPAATTTTRRRRHAEAGHATDKRGKYARN